MTSVSHTNEFTQDTKAVAPVVASILLLGFVVIGLAGFQAIIVPQQNAETELQHFQSVQNEMEQIVDAIDDVEQQNRAQFSTIQLGVTYQQRTLTINPPPATGSLQTSDEYNITIQGENGTEEEISTRFVEYQPGYNEFKTGSIWYENSRAYIEHEETGDYSLITTNSLVSSDGTLNIIALQNDFYESGTNRLTVELYPKQTGDINIDELDDELNVTIPTRLDENHWNESLSDELPTEDFEVREDDTYEDENVNALKVFDIDLDDLDITTVGIQSAATGAGAEGLEEEEPEEEPAIEALTSDDEDGDLIGAGGDGSPGRFEFGLRNSGESELDIVAIGIINTSVDAANVRGPGDNAPLTQDGTDLIDSSEITINDATNDADRNDFIENEEKRIEGNDTVEGFVFNRFRDGNSPPPGGNQVDMDGSIVNITVWATDENGDESQTTLELNDTE